jgi:hypothetical protein
MLTHIHPSHIQFTCGHRSDFNGTVCPTQSSEPAKTRQVPRAPLPAQGVTLCSVASYFHQFRPHLIPGCHGKPCKGVYDTDFISDCIQPLPSFAVCGFCTSSGRVTPPSQLILAHAPDQNPPSVFSCPYTEGLCRLLSVPAGSWPFPTLSPQSLYRCLDPYPAASLRCICPFLPKERRPHHRDYWFGTLNIPCNATSTGGSDFGGAVIPLCSGSHTR